MRIHYSLITSRNIASGCQKVKRNNTQSRQPFPSLSQNNDIHNTVQSKSWSSSFVLTKNMAARDIICPLSWLEGKKNHFRRKENLFGGGLGDILDPVWIFHCATPRGLICWVTVWGNGALLAANSFFHCAIPRGLIRWVIWGYGALLAANSIFHCATPRGLICCVTVWGYGALLAANSIFHCASPGGLIPW